MPRAQAVIATPGVIEFDRRHRPGAHGAGIPACGSVAMLQNDLRSRSGLQLGDDCKRRGNACTSGVMGSIIVRNTTSLKPQGVVLQVERRDLVRGDAVDHTVSDDGRCPGCDLRGNK
jgi:hypothetical protein